MRIRHPAALALAWLGLGCASLPRVMGPEVEAALRSAEPGLPIRAVVASTHVSRDHGRGLAVDVRVARDPAAYSRDLQPEIDGAAVVLAALARSPLAVRWNFVDLRFSNDYGRMPPRGRSVCGVAHVLISREAIMELRAAGAPPEDYSRRWRLVAGYKDQPDSRALLQW